MNTMVVFAKSNGTTKHFREQAILEIRVAYRIMEYLAPDETFPPKVNQFTKGLMLKGEFAKAYEYVMEELNEEFSTDLGSSMSAEGTWVYAVELMKYLLPLYEKSCTDKKEQRRIQLLKELKELEA